MSSLQAVALAHYDTTSSYLLPYFDSHGGIFQEFSWLKKDKRLWYDKMPQGTEAGSFCPCINEEWQQQAGGENFSMSWGKSLDASWFSWLVNEAVGLGFKVDPCPS